MAAEVNDHHQSFFPPDVHYVGDHAVRFTNHSKIDPLRVFTLRSGSIISGK